MLVTRTRLSFFACQKYAVGDRDALEKAALGSGQQKNRLQPAPASQHWTWIYKRKHKIANMRVHDESELGFFWLGPKQNFIYFCFLKPLIKFWGKWRKYFDPRVDLQLLTFVWTGAPRSNLFARNTGTNNDSNYFKCRHYRKHVGSGFEPPSRLWSPAPSKVQSKFTEGTGTGILEKISWLWSFNIEMNILKVKMFISIIQRVEQKNIRGLSGLPNCVMLHKNLKVAWESFAPQLTIQVR